jgi:dTDP-4-amino-4,6-dideoxygalactose transaminase
MRVPLLDLRAQYDTIRDDIARAIERVLDTQHFILGPEVDALEKAIADYAGVRHAVGMSSGTDAILVVLMAAGVGPGDEVVTTPYTFIATCSSIARLGARAVFADIDPRSYNLDAHAASVAVTARTKAIMPVHLFGQMADMGPLARLAADRGIALIEDAAQALGSKLDGIHAGCVGTAGTYSFFPSKNLGGFGDGGMVVTNDDELATRLRLLRNQGQQPKYFSVLVGGNFRLDALQAAVLRAKLPHLDRWTAARQRNAERYRAMFAASGLVLGDGGVLADGAAVALPVELPGRRHVYNQFVIRSRRRDELRRHLTEAGIGCEVYYPQPMHMQACFASWGYRAGDFPESERAAAESLAIPVYPELTPPMMEHIVSSVVDFHR